jgi:dolichol-phosphate mannosyltransferase
MELSIVIPCYNEVENVPKLKQELLPVLHELMRERSIELVFVDDGSTDGTLQALKDALEGETPEIARKYEAHPTNYGLGRAIRTGFAAASGEIIVTTDSDGTYKFSSLPSLLDCLSDGVDIVTASPYHPQGGVVGVPRYRLVLSQGSSLIYRLLVDRHIHTYTCLYRAYRREVIDSIQFASDGFLGGTELMVKAMLFGFRVAEFPAVLYRRTFGASKAKIARTIRAHLGFQWTVLLHQLHIRTLVKRNGKKGDRGWNYSTYSAEKGS